MTVKSCFKVVTFVNAIFFLNAKLCRVSGANEAKLRPPRAPPSARDTLMLDEAVDSYITSPPP
jgi:hypothetical protein